MGSAEARRRVRLLAESDRLLGLKDWPVSRQSVQAVALPLSSGPDREEPAAMTRKANAAHTSRDAQPQVQAAGPAAAELDASRRARLEQLIEQFPPEIEPPGIDPQNRPDLVRSAHYGLRGSAVEVVRLKAEALARQAEQVDECQRCGLYKVCTQKVFGVGHPDARIVFVGKAPGAEEDRVGYPFMGRAGALLTAMVERGMGLRREHVYICNVVKCRPPDNRTPTTDEMAACEDHLWAQLATIEPEVIVALGVPATQALLSTKQSLSRLRGQFYDINLSEADLTGGRVAKCLPTYHPAYLLRYPADKKKAWEDLKKIMAEMGIPPLGQQ